MHRKCHYQMRYKIRKKVCGVDEMVKLLKVWIVRLKRWEFYVIKILMKIPSFNGKRIIFTKLIKMHG